MMLRTIIEIFKRQTLSNVKTPLGRWNIHNYSQTMLKIKYANEDNCGVCCENVKKQKEINKNEDFDDDDDKYIYMMGYESVPA